MRLQQAKSVESDFPNERRKVGGRKNNGTVALR